MIRWDRGSLLTRRWAVAAGAFILCAGATMRPAQAQWRGGRPLEDGPTFRFGLTGGQVFDLDGEVRETDRPLYAFTDDHSGAPPESYSWSELGFDDRYNAFGFFMERQRRYVTWLLDGSYGRPTVSGVADRDYYIGVGSVTFGGRTYTHLVIPEGTSYRGEINAFAFAFAGRITPTGYARGRFAFTPWIHLGIFGFAGDYELEAGPAEGVTRYERPPRDYVIRGRATGMSGVLVPEVGVGMDLTVPLTGASEVMLQGFAGGMQIRARSGFLGFGARNEKMVGLDYVTLGARLEYARRLSDRLDLILGAAASYRHGEAEVRAKERAPEEVIARREKFDKDATFEMTSVSGYIGLRF